jgi:hypothetical protein
MKGLPLKVTLLLLMKEHLTEVNSPDIQKYEDGT